MPYLWGMTFGGTVNGLEWSREVELAVALPAETLQAFLRARGLPAEITDSHFVPGRPRDGCGVDPPLR